MVIGKDSILQPYELIITVKQEINGGASSERLGIVTICLAHHARTPKSTTRYLLQDSKSNSLLKISIQLDLIKGDLASFRIPPPSSKTLLPVALNNNNERVGGGGGVGGEDSSNNAYVDLIGGDGSAEHASQNRFSIEQLNIIDPETQDSELVDSFFSQAQQSNTLHRSAQHNPSSTTTSLKPAL